MKKIIIPVTIMLLFVHSSTALFAQEAKGPKNPIMDAAEKAVDDFVGQDKNKNESTEDLDKEKDDDSESVPSPSPSPSVSPKPASPTPSPVIEFEIPPVVLPVIGGQNEKENKKEENTRNTRNDEREEDDEMEITPTPTVSPRSVEAPKSVQVKQREQVEQAEKEDNDDNSMAAVITKPIDPPLSLVRGAVKGSFYNSTGLSQQTTLYAILASLGFLGTGLILMKNDLVKYFVKRGSVLPLPKSEPFTIPYIGNQYK